MMIKYIELTCPTGKKIAFKMDSIQTVEEWSDGSACVKGIRVSESYETVKSIVMNDERRVCYDPDMDFRIRALIRNGLYERYKTMGNTKSLEFTQEILFAKDEGEVIQIEERYYRGQG